MLAEPASFLLFKLQSDAHKFATLLQGVDLVRWAAPVYGPYQVVAYAESESSETLETWIESLRTTDGVSEVDARAVKVIPEDRTPVAVHTEEAECSVLLIGVNYREERERVVTLRLREIPGVVLARAMWGPADIIAIVEAQDHEALRNLICDHVKTLAGVQSNTTLYCYARRR